MRMIKALNRFGDKKQHNYAYGNKSLCCFIIIINNNGDDDIDDDV